jgi:signal transduction histidine kinase
MRLWPDTLAGRTLALLIGTTLLLIIISAVLLHDERKKRFDERNQFSLVERVITLARLVNNVDIKERQRIIKQILGPGDDITLSKLPRVTSPPIHSMEKVIAHKLRHTLNIKNRLFVRVQAEFKHQQVTKHNHSPFDRNNPHDLTKLNISIHLWDGIWLNFSTKHFEKAPPWANRTLQLLFLVIVVLVISGLLIARRMAQPMAQLADAAERFGLGHSQSPLPEKGPREVRHTIRAFNRMQERLHKHITDRSQMLAAVSHDLRTPITTLRLRAEYIEDPEMREKTLTTLSEMEAILSATLNFARDEAADEQARTTDLAALLQSVVDDHADLGGDATYHGPERLKFVCRPVALKRALNNLIENALKYGATTEVFLSAIDSGVEILVKDSGPGIPTEQLQAVITPFFRLESSRNRKTGGTGLGLAVANSIILAHGGELSLANQTEGGLQVRVILNQQ